MDKLPVEIIRKVYEYDPTYRESFDKTLRQLRVFCFVYRCSECFKPYNKCFCYCNVCKTYLRFCKQIYFENNDPEEDELNDIIELS